MDNDGAKVNCRGRCLKSSHFVYYFGKKRSLTLEIELRRLKGTDELLLCLFEQDTNRLANVRFSDGFSIDPRLTIVLSACHGRMSDATRWRGYQMHNTKKKRRRDEPLGLVMHKKIHADTCVSFLTPGHVTTPFHPAGITDPLRGMLLTHTQQRFLIQIQVRPIVYSRTYSFPKKDDQE